MVLSGIFHSSSVFVSMPFFEQIMFSGEDIRLAYDAYYVWNFVLIEFWLLYFRSFIFYHSDVVFRNVVRWQYNSRFDDGIQCAMLISMLSFDVLFLILCFWSIHVCYTGAFRCEINTFNVLLWLAFNALRFFFLQRNKHFFSAFPRSREE